MRHIYDLVKLKIDNTLLGNTYYIRLYRGAKDDILYAALQILIPVLLIAILAKYITKRRCTIRYFVMFIWSYYLSVVLHITIISREYRDDVWGHIFEGWGALDKAECAEAIENTVMLLPIILLLFIGVGRLIFKKIEFKNIIITSFKIIFATSLSIELIQARLGRGTFQIADLVYNTLGGCIGGLIYYVMAKIADRLEKLLD